MNLLEATRRGEVGMGEDEAPIRIVPGQYKRDDTLGIYTPILTEAIRQGAGLPSFCGKNTGFLVWGGACPASYCVGVEYFGCCFRIGPFHTLERMTHQYAPTAVDLDKLRVYDTCTISNAIEQLDVRLRNEGFIAHTVQCQFPQLAPMVGYAATGRIRTSSPPMTHRCYYDRPDWWSYVASVPEPRILVLQDVDPTPGLGAFVGELHAAIGQALHCVGCVTNGAVRDLPAAEAAGFQMFAGSVSVSHAYAHVIEFGEPVELGGLKITSGDLLHGDRHGVLRIPYSIAAQISEEAYKIRCQERELVKYCKSPDFSLEELTERIRNASAHCDLPWRPR